MPENPLIRISHRWLEILHEEIESWVEATLRDAFNPEIVMQLIGSMGIDISQLQGMIGRQPGFDPYRILGLDRSASDEAVRKRYRELLHKLHPDTAGVEGTAFLLQMVLAAYETIKRERDWR